MRLKRADTSFRSCSVFTTLDINRRLNPIVSSYAYAHMDTTEGRSRRQTERYITSVTVKDRVSPQVPRARSHTGE